MVQYVETVTGVCIHHSKALLMPLIQGFASYLCPRLIFILPLFLRKRTFKILKFLGDRAGRPECVKVKWNSRVIKSNSMQQATLCLYSQDESCHLGHTENKGRPRINTGLV